MIVVDDHPMWRQTLRTVLEQNGAGKVVAEASDGEEALRVSASSPADVILMDIDLPGMNGTETTKEILRRAPDARVLVLSASDDRSDVVDAVRAGAAGYLLKTAEPAEVVDAVRRVHAGEAVFPAGLADVILDELRHAGGRAGQISVALADASVLFREGLARILEEAGFDVVAQASRAEELFDANAPDVVITDAREGIDVVERLRSAHPGIGVVVLSRDLDAEAASSLLVTASGGVAYLLTDRVSDVEQLAATIRNVARGGSVLDPEVASRLVRRTKERDPLGDLSDREREVLAVMAEGRTNQAICERLYMSPKAVEAHVRNIYMKLGLEQARDDSRRVLAVLTYLRSV